MKADIPLCVKKHVTQKKKGWEEGEREEERKRERNKRKWLLLSFNACTFTFFIFIFIFICFYSFRTMTPFTVTGMGNKRIRNILIQASLKIKPLYFCQISKWVNEWRNATFLRENTLHSLQYFLTMLNFPRGKIETLIIETLHPGSSSHIVS